MKNSVLGLLFVVLLTACGSAAPEPVVTATPTSLPTKVATSTIVPSSMLTLTATPRPSRTPTKTPSYTIVPFERDHWTRYWIKNDADNIQGIVSDLALAPDGIVWGTSNAGVFQLTEESLQVYNSANGLPNGGASALEINPAGQVWAATGVKDQLANHISFFDGQSWTTLDGFGRDTKPFLIDSQDWVWFGIQANDSRDINDGGVVYFDGSNWIRITEATGLIDNTITGIIEDLDNNIWVGTSEGLSRFDGESWEAFPIERTEGVGAVYNLVISPDGTQWFTSQRGLFQKDGDEWTQHWDASLSFPILSLLPKNEGKLWIGMSSTFSIVYFDGTDYILYQTPFSTAFSMIEDLEGRLWIGTENGVYIYDDR